MELRLATYNVHKCVGLDRRRRPERILEVINALSADIVALQEVDHRIPPRPAALPPDLIAHETDFGVLPFAPNETSLGWHGQTILVRHGLKVETVRRVLLPGLEPRGAILAELDLPGGPFRVVGVHLALIRRYRLMQLAAIRAAIGRRGDMPTVILGDYNEWTSHGCTEVLSPGFRLHAGGPSFPAARAFGALDRIAISEGVHLRHAGIHSDTPARVASDHLPLWADVRIGPREKA